MKTLLLILLSLLLLNCIFGYYFGYIKVNEKSPTYKKGFYINVENYTYKLHFIHYGNIKENMQINIYLNGKLVYSIDDSIDGSGSYKKNASIDLTNYLKDGENVLKVEGINLKGNETYHPYYVLDNVEIKEPTKSPISFGSNVLTLILIGIIIFYYRKKNSEL
ncbi:conserved protein of unknown function [Methanocaldococcus lauensis]|nr:conserved protein of unknown function [Methanocaldococcus lauensis]